MKPFLLLAIVASLAVTGISPFTASATAANSSKRLKKAKPTPEPEKSKAFSEIKSVSGDSITVTHSKTTTTYKMSNETQIRVDGQSVRSTSLKPGMHVEVTPSGINPTLLLSVSATTPSKN
jgi:hypothetical protein